jgi:hypothetical protein
MKPNDSLTNFIPISRKLFDHQFFKQRRVFSWFEAWVDLIQMARYEETEGKVLTTDGKMIKYNRAEIPASVRFLATRWQWGHKKLIKFQTQLKADGMVTTRLSEGQTIIKISNYDLYNKALQRGNAKGNTSKPILVKVSEAEENNEGLKRGTQGERKGNESNKENIVNKEEREESSSPTLSPDLYSQFDRDEFKSLQKWISNNTPFVAKMKCQITIDELIRLRKKSWYTNQNLMSILGKMDNYKGISKNIYVYRTVLNWAEREYNK